MNNYYNAFDVSPVPAPGPDAVAPEVFRGIYGMPAFATIPTGDLDASVDYWTRALGFIELFSVPGRLVHLRRWAFQDVLLVPSASVDERVPAMGLFFACVLGQIDSLVAACRAMDDGAVSEPYDTPWNTRDLEVITPERARVVFTAAKPFDPSSEEAANLEAMGIVPEGGHREEEGRAWAKTMTPRA